VVSEENVEIVREQHAVFDQLVEGREIRSWVYGYFDSACEYRPVEELEPVCGHQALIEWTERWLEAWSSYSERIEEIIDGGEVVLSATTISARGRTSGLEIQQRLFCVFEMREGKILRLVEYLDRDEALEAAGLRGH
jgi:hypothetical protein